MRISDWSSDVCSSDLYFRPGNLGPNEQGATINENNAATCNGGPYPQRTCSTALFVIIFTIQLNRSFSFRSGSRNREVSDDAHPTRSEEHTSELQSLMRISYAVFCLKKKTRDTSKNNT